MRHFEGDTLALHAHGNAMEIVIAFAHCVVADSPVDAGVVTTP